MVEYLVTQMPCVNNMQNLVLLQTFIHKLFFFLQVWVEPLLIQVLLSL